MLIDDLLKGQRLFLFVVDYTGLKVDKFAELRKRLSGIGAEIHVFKNNLVKKAAEKAGYPGELGDHLTGQSAFVTGAKDVFGTAKILKNFQAEFEKPVMKVGVLDGNLLDTAAIKVLADLPSREVLYPSSSVCSRLRLPPSPACSRPRPTRKALLPKKPLRLLLRNNPHNPFDQMARHTA
ncbi:50S ribosomal protein L10 [Prosthecobacter sp.]|uniref:50S ribosomal protein L10 n=1 Tax=Prosthecobacter sp. TaxID=1965333 RepID=UPI0037832D02